MYIVHPLSGTFEQRIQLMFCCYLFNYCRSEHGIVVEFITALRFMKCRWICLIEIYHGIRKLLVHFNT